MPYFNPPNKFSQEFNKKTPFREETKAKSSPKPTSSSSDQTSSSESSSESNDPTYSVSGEGLDLTDKKKQSKVKVGTSKRDYGGLGAGLEAGLKELGAAIASATAR